MARKAKCYRCKKVCENWSMFCLDCIRQLEYPQKLMREVIQAYHLELWKLSNDPGNSKPQWLFEMAWALDWEQYLKRARLLKIEKAKKLTVPIIETLEKQIDWIENILRTHRIKPPLLIRKDYLIKLDEYYKRKEEAQRSKGFTI